MHENSQDAIRIYTGPAMIAKGLVVRLNKLGISPIERNDNESSIQAGFTVGVPGQVMLYIREEELPMAQDTINEYLREIVESKVGWPKPEAGIRGLGRAEGKDEDGL